MLPLFLWYFKVVLRLVKSVFLVKFIKEKGRAWTSFWGAYQGSSSSWMIWSGFHLLVKGCSMTVTWPYSISGHSSLLPCYMYHIAWRFTSDLLKCLPLRFPALSIVICSQLFKQGNKDPCNLLIPSCHRLPINKASLGTSIPYVFDLLPKLQYSFSGLWDISSSGMGEEALVDQNRVWKKSFSAPDRLSWG